MKFLNQLKTQKKSPLCYFTKDISKPYHNLHSVGKTREDRQKKNTEKVAQEFLERFTILIQNV